MLYDLDSTSSKQTREVFNSTKTQIFAAITSTNQGPIIAELQNFIHGYTIGFHFGLSVYSNDHNSIKHFLTKFMTTIFGPPSP